MTRAEAAEERKRSRHWAVTLVFGDAIEQGLNKRGWRPFSERIKRKTGLEIAPGTLKYWYAGLSEPKTSELEAMAAAVGLELELIIEETTKT